MFEWKIAIVVTIVLCSASVVLVMRIMLVEKIGKAFRVPVLAGMVQEMRVQARKPDKLFGERVVTADLQKKKYCYYFFQVIKFTVFTDAFILPATARSLRRPMI